MIASLLSIFNILNSNQKPQEVSLGVVLGMFAGLTMIAPVNLLIILLVLLLFKANGAIFWLSLALFKLLGLTLDAAGDPIGYAVLTAGFMKPLFTFLSNVPLLLYTGFNNTVIMGDFIIGLILIVPVWRGTNSLIEYYRKNLQPKVEKWKLVKALKALNTGEKLKSKLAGE